MKTKERKSTSKGVESKGKNKDRSGKDKSKGAQNMQEMWCRIVFCISETWRQSRPRRDCCGPVHARRKTHVYKVRRHGEHNVFFPLCRTWSQLDRCPVSWVWFWYHFDSSIVKAM